MVQLEPKIRQSADTDRAFICSTWLQSFKFESPWANRITWQVFKTGHSKILDKLLARSDVLIACDPDNEDEIAGYVVYEPNAVHFAYVKPAFRRAGIFTALLSASGLPPDLAGVAVTHGTRAWFSAPPVQDKAGNILKPGRPGLEERFKAEHNPYFWMEV